MKIENKSEMSEDFYVEDKPTMKERVYRKLFPNAYGKLVQESNDFFEKCDWVGDGDCILFNSTTHWSLMDRLRLLFSGVSKVSARFICENKPGRIQTFAICYAAAPEKESK